MLVMIYKQLVSKTKYTKNEIVKFENNYNRYLFPLYSAYEPLETKYQTIDIEYVLSYPPKYHHFDELPLM